MKYEEFENDIIQRLKIKGVETKELPHVGVLNEPRTTTKPRLFVIINGVNYDTPESLSGPVQEETIQGEVFIRTKNRRGKLGVFDLHGKIKDLIMGYKPAGALTGIVLNQFAYVAGIQNNWQYALTFSFTAICIPSEKPEVHGIIKKIDTPIE